MSHRRRSGLRHDGGASAVEYGAILILVAALAAVFTVVALPERVKTNTAAAICQLFSGNDARDCPDGRPPAPVGDDPNTGNDPNGNDPALPDPPAQNQPPATDPADPALDPDDPDVKTYNDAKKEADAANQALNDLNGLSEQAKQEILDLLKDIVGITDIEDCLTKGDIVACISALAGLVPWGKVLKVLKKIPGAVKLAKKLKNLWDQLADAKARKKKADDALDEAKKKLDEKPALCPVKKPSSFLPGTRVLLADGSSKHIDQIEVGDLVWATDPVSRVSGPRPVTHLISSRGAKHLTTLSTGFLGRLGPTVTATGDHPFWAPDVRAWRKASQLASGASLSMPDGRTVALTEADGHTGSVRVHNLTVAGLHTYYVLIGDTPVLAHNSDPCTEKFWPKGEPSDLCDISGSTGCEDVARTIQRVIGGERMRITDRYGAPTLGKYRGQDSFWGHHDVVVKDGRVYDAWTGPEGEPMDVYRSRFEYGDDLVFSPAP
ncbi:Hint domain-containing protein [Actinocorallia aurantiaca]|uniref:Hint domain-containing protein n=1 Tax=Actinocorallia aurantiaca TaxID=46204 RepID=UPI0031E09D6E